MKFSVLTPALLAALAASASAYELTDAESCAYETNLLICSTKTDETTCTANAKCAWASSSVCTINTADATKYLTDDTAADAVLQGHADFQACTAKAEADCTGDCALASVPAGANDALIDMCIPTMEKAKEMLTGEGVPKAIVALKQIDVFEYLNCFSKEDESTCNAVAGCEWDADESPKCVVTVQKEFDIKKDTCGSDGDWAAAGAATGLSSGAADSASRFAVLAASAVAAASLLA